MGVFWTFGFYLLHSTVDVDLTIKRSLCFVIPQHIYMSTDWELLYPNFECADEYTPQKKLFTSVGRNSRPRCRCWVSFTFYVLITLCFGGMYLTTEKHRNSRCPVWRPERPELIRVYNHKKDVYGFLSTYLYTYLYIHIYVCIFTHTCVNYDNLLTECVNTVNRSHFRHSFPTSYL